VEINISKGTRDYEISVRDDGVGFAPASPSKAARGFGLFHLKERLELFGGHLTVEAGVPSGSIVRVSLPPEGVSADYSI
jgi:signal transduction histidine kinase